MQSHELAVFSLFSPNGINCKTRQVYLHNNSSAGTQQPRLHDIAKQMYKKKKYCVGMGGHIFE